MKKQKLSKIKKNEIEIIDLTDLINEPDSKSLETDIKEQTSAEIFNNSLLTEDISLLSSISKLDQEWLELEQNICSQTSNEASIIFNDKPPSPILATNEYPNPSSLLTISNTKDSGPPTAVNIDVIIYNFIISQPNLYSKILTYQPIEVASIKKGLAEKGYKVDKNVIKKVLDLQSIIMADSQTKRRYKKPLRSVSFIKKKYLSNPTDP